MTKEIYQAPLAAGLLSHGATTRKNKGPANTTAYCADESVERSSYVEKINTNSEQTSDRRLLNTSMQPPPLGRMEAQEYQQTRQWLPRSTNRMGAALPSTSSHLRQDNSVF